MEKTTEKQVVVFQGGGQYFFWQMGVVKYLSEHFDLTETTMIVGASAGALAAVFLVCGVNANTALECALRLCDEVKVWERWLKFMGIWGSMVEQWLDQLLPDNAAELCTNKVHILISQVLKPKKVVSTFATKQELIECLLTSTHIPFFMDYSPFRWFQGWWCYDGCIGNFTNHPYKVFNGKDHKYYFFSFQDDNHHKYSIFHGLPTNNKVDVADLIQHGFQYAKRLHETNRLNLQYRRDSPGLGISSVPDGPEDCMMSIPPPGL